MALTRKMLKAMELDEDKISQIYEAHQAVIDEIAAERDKFKSDAEKLPGVEKQLEKANAELEKFKADDWETKYNTVKGEYDTYKKDTETKAVKAAKEAAYRKLLLDAGISDKRVASILRVSDVDGITLDKDGNLEGAEKLAETVKTEWADFIVTKQEQGATTPKPKTNEGGDGVKQPSRAAQMAAQYANEHYGNSKED